MKGTTKTRSQRRMEKKQAVILLVLVLAVSLASFTLGVVVGRRGAERDFAHRQQAAEKILVTKAPKQLIEPRSETKTEAADEGIQEKTADTEEETKLTFYDNLAKEEKVPLGSGINLPPEVEKKKIAAKPPIELPENPIVKKDVAVEVAKVENKPVAVEAEETIVLPKADATGTYAVQVGSFSSVVDAGAFEKKLLKKNYPAFVVGADLGAKGLWYRVKVGPYAKGADAKSVLQILDKKEQIKGFISRQ